jgi:cation diffusion facilitator family transporter
MSGQEEISATQDGAQEADPLRGEPQALASKGRNSAITGVYINALLAVGKITGGILGHSFALVADGIESSTDILSSLVVYTGLKFAVKPPDVDHPYGHGKGEPIAALAVGVALVGAAISIAVQSLREIITPHKLPEPFTLIILAGVLVTKEILFRYVVRIGKDINSIAVQTDAWHHRSDAITSALAFVGISIALIGGKGWESADDWAALLASFIILFNAVAQIRPALAELSDVAPPKTIQAEVKAVARHVPGVEDLEKCFVRKMGFHFYVDLHVVVNGALSVREGHRIAHEVKSAILSAYPRVTEVLVHIEPTDSSKNAAGERKYKIAK